MSTTAICSDKTFTQQRLNTATDLWSDLSFEIKQVKDKFNIYGSVRHRNNILVHKSQQDAHVTEFI